MIKKKQLVVAGGIGAHCGRTVLCSRRLLTFLTEPNLLHIGYIQNLRRSLLVTLSLDPKGDWVSFAVGVTIAPAARRIATTPASQPCVLST